MPGQFASSDDPYLCGEIEATNDGDGDASLSATDFQVVNPTGQISTPAVVSGPALSPTFVSLVPGATGIINACFATRGVSGEFTIRYVPHGTVKTWWKVHV